MLKSVDLHQFSLSWTSLEDIGDCDAGVSVGKMRIVPASRHCNSEPISRDSLKCDMVELPGYPLSALQQSRILPSLLDTGVCWERSCGKHFDLVEMSLFSLCHAEFRWFGVNIVINHLISP